MKVQRVQIELFGDANFFFSKLRCREEAIQSPESPRDGGIEADPSSVQTEDCIFAEAIDGEPAEAKIYIPLIGNNCWIRRDPDRTQGVEVGSFEIPQQGSGCSKGGFELSCLSGWNRSWKLRLYQSMSRLGIEHDKTNFPLGFMFQRIFNRG